MDEAGADHPSARLEPVVSAGQAFLSVPWCRVFGMTMRHDLPYRGPFDLSASTRFLAGFAPAARPDAAAVPGE